MIATPIVMIVTPIAKKNTITRYTFTRTTAPPTSSWCGLGPSVQLVLMLTGGTADAFIIVFSFSVNDIIIL